MNYSVIIPSLVNHDGEYLKLCVKSLRDSGFGGQIIVVTNGQPVIHKLDIPGVSIHLHTTKQGQCHAVNEGAKVATGDYLLISNSDMYYAPGWDKNLHFEHPVFSPNLVEPVNNAGSAAPFLKFDGGLDLNEFRREFVDGFIRREVDKLPDEEAGLNFPLFIKREFWNFLGGYDEAYDPWGSNSDTDLQTRINLAGVTPLRLRDVLVYHFSNKTPTFAPENDGFRLNNFEYFKGKFGFDRDELGSDVWYNKDMLPTDDRNKYKQERYNG